MPAVVSMSLGADSTDDVLDAAVLSVINQGATLVTAAGNFNNGSLPSAHFPQILSTDQPQTYTHAQKRHDNELGKFLENGQSPRK